MLRCIADRRAQSIIEYALLIAVVVAALIAMQIFFKRALSGKIKDTANRVGDQYNPKGASYTYSTQSNSDSTEIVEKGMRVQNVVNSMSQTSTSTDTFKGFNKDDDAGLQDH